MRLILDTHLVLAVLAHDPTSLWTEHRSLLDNQRNILLVSVASLWEIAIKARLGKLTLATPLHQIPAELASANVSLVDIRPEHVLEGLKPVPPTKDPFDKLLLAVAQVEGAALVTGDAKLLGHPAAWKPASA